MRFIEDTKKIACYCTYNFHRKSSLEKLKSLLNNHDQLEYPVVLLCGPEGSGRDFFVHTVAFQQSLNDEPVVVLTLDYDGFNQETSTLSQFINHQIECSNEFNDAKTRQLLESIKSEIHLKVGSDLIPFFTFGVKLGLSLNDLKEMFHSYAPKPQRSERELILHLLERVASKGKLVLHMKNALVNCSDAVGLLIQESFRRKALIAISCESEDEFRQFFPGESYEAIHFSPYNRSEFNELINQKYHPNTFDTYFYDLLYRYTQGVPELLAAKMEDIEKQGLFRMDNRNRYFIAEEDLSSKKIMDLFLDLFEPYEKIHGENKVLLDELLKIACLCGRYFPIQQLIHFMELDEPTSTALQDLIDDELTECTPVPLLTDYGYGHACFYKIEKGKNIVNIYRFYPAFRNYLLCRMTDTEKAQKAKKLLSFLEAHLPIQTRAMAKIFIELSNFAQINQQIKKYQNYLIFWVRRENADALKKQIIQQLTDYDLNPDVLWAIIEQTKDEWHPLLRLALIEAYEQNPEGIPHSQQSPVLSEKGLIYFFLAEYHKAEPLMRKVLEIEEASFGPNLPNVATALNNLASLLQATNRLSEAEPLMRRALKIGEDSLGLNHTKVAIRLNNLAQLLQDTNRLSEAEPLMRRALKIDEDSLGPNHPDVARDLNNLARLLKVTNRLSEAEPLMRRVIEITEKSLGPNHPNVATALNNLAELLRDTNRLDEAEPLYKRALKIDEDFLGPNHPKVAGDLNNLALLLQATNCLSEAEPMMRRALKIVEDSFGPNHPNAAITLNNLAALLQDTKRLSQAEPLMRRALKIDEDSLGPNHPDVARNLNNLAELLRVTGRFNEAEPLMRRALKIDEDSFGKDHPKVAIRLNNLAQLLQDTNRLSEAEPLMRRALKIDEDSLGPNHPKVAIRLNNLAQLLKDTNRLSEAEPLMRRALKIDEDSFGKDHPNVARDFNNLALLLKATNRLSEAEPLMRRALKIDEDSFGKDHPNVARDLNNLAALLKDTNRLSEAEPLMRRALKIDEASFGKDHPNVAIRLNNLAQLLKATNRLSEAEPMMRRALKIFEDSLGPDHPSTVAVRNNLQNLK